MSAAIAASQAGKSVVLIERGVLGGTCVNTGCVPTRVLAKTARLMREIRTADAYGISVSEGPLDWPTIVARVRQTVDRVRLMKNEATRFADAGVELILEGRARFLDASTLRLESGRRVTAGAVLVCVGGHSRRLPVAGREEPGPRA